MTGHRRSVQRRSRRIPSESRRNQHPGHSTPFTPLRWLGVLSAIGLTLAIGLPGIPRAGIAEPGGTNAVHTPPGTEPSLRLVAALPLLHRYGSAIGMDSLNNSVVGGSGNRRVAYRFRASSTSRLRSIRVYVMGPDHSGYGAGTGGTWQVTVQPDDGSTQHRPSGKVLASATMQPTKTFPVIRWSTAASLKRGRLYHIVFTNVDPNASSNYASLNGVFTYRRTARRQPAFTNRIWAQLSRSAGGGWSESSNTVPIMQLNYANGVVRGVGYMEVWIRAAKNVSGHQKARETFKVRGANRRITRVAVRLARVSGSSPLRIRLERGNGKRVASCRVPASKITSSGNASWVGCKFRTPRTLRSGHRYHLVVKTAADTSYSIYVIRKGSMYGFSSRTYFSDGHAQYNAGGGWGGFDQPGGSGNASQADLQFYLR